jgi:large subunit ribosomal protein L3e
VCGATKRTVTLRKMVNPSTKKIMVKEISLKWMDTASKFGHGRFQTKEDRRRFMWKTMIGKLAEAAKTAACGSPCL